MSVNSKMTAIADAIRGKTGGTDLLTLDAMATQIAGIETGGGGSASGIYMAKITPAEDMGTMPVMHNLNTKDIMVALCFAEDFGDMIPTSTTTIAKAWMDTDILCRYGMTYNPGFNSAWKYDPTNSRAENMLIANSGYWDYVSNENTFTFNRASNGYTYMAGLTYSVIIMAASAFSAAEV